MQTKNKKTRIRYNIKRPGTNKRITYAITEDVAHPDGNRVQRKIVDERLDAINAARLAGATNEVCEAQIATLVKSLKERWHLQNPSPAILLAENQKLLDTYWKSEYTHRVLVDEAAAYNELRRAIEAMGAISLYTVSSDELKLHLQKAFKTNPEKHRRVLAKLKVLLKFIGRREVLKVPPPKRVRVPVTHVTTKELELVLAQLRPDLRLAAKAAFGSGARVGELLALRSRHINGDIARIEEQIDRKGVVRLPKSKQRKAAIIPEFVEDVVEFAALPLEGRLPISRLDLSRELKAACIKAFPSDKEKHLTWHGLRHCYAVHLLGKGVPISHVAQSLGDSEAIAREYYSGFILTLEGIELIRARLKGA